MMYRTLHGLLLVVLLMVGAGRAEAQSDSVSPAAGQWTQNGDAAICLAQADFPNGRTARAVLAALPDTSATITLTLRTAEGEDEVVTLRGSPRGIVGFVSSVWTDEIAVGTGDMRASEAIPGYTVTTVQLRGCFGGVEADAAAFVVHGETGSFSFGVKVDGGEKEGGWTARFRGRRSQVREWRAFIVANMPRPQVARTHAAD